MMGALPPKGDCLVDSGADDAGAGDNSGDGTPVLQPKPIREKNLHEHTASLLLRRNSWVSNLGDLIATIFSAIVSIFSKSSSAFSPTANLTNQISTTSNQVGFVGGWFFFFNYFFYGLRMTFFGIGKQNRAGKIAQGFLTVCGSILAGNTLFVLGLLGFTMAAGLSLAFIALPWVYAFLHIGMIVRNTIRFWRTSKGLDPSGLLAQKEEKLRLATEAKPFMDLAYLQAIKADRVARFTLEVSLFKYFLKSFNGTPFITKKDLAHSVLFKQYEKNTLSRKDLYHYINQHFKGDYQAFIERVNQGDETCCELANRHAVGLMVDQQSKYAARRKFYIICTIMSLSFLIIAILGFLVTGGTAAVPLFAIGAAAITGLKIAGAAVGLSVLACMGALTYFSLKSAYDEYVTWQKKAKACPADSPEYEKRQALLKAQKISMGLRISGMALMLVSSLFIATAFLPFVNVAVLGFVGMGLIVASAAIFLAGAVKLHRARQIEKSLDCPKLGDDKPDEGNNPGSDNQPPLTPAPLQQLLTTATPPIEVTVAQPTTTEPPLSLLFQQPPPAPNTGGPQKILCSPSSTI